MAALMVSESSITRHHQACGWPGPLPRLSTPMTSRPSPPTRLTCAHSKPSAGSAVSENSHRHNCATTDRKRSDPALRRPTATVSIVSNLRTGFAARTSSEGSLAPSRRRQTTSTHMRSILPADYPTAIPRTLGRPSLEGGTPCRRLVERASEAVLQVNNHGGRDNNHGATALPAARRPLDQVCIRDEVRVRKARWRPLRGAPKDT